MADYDIKKSTSAYHSGAATASVQVIARSENGYRIIKSFRFTKGDLLSLTKATRKANELLDKLTES